MGETTKKNIREIIIGFTNLLIVIPILNHIIFNGERILEYLIEIKNIINEKKRINVANIAELKRNR